MESSTNYREDTLYWLDNGDGGVWENIEQGHVLRDIAIPLKDSVAIQSGI